MEGIRRFVCVVCLAVAVLVGLTTRADAAIIDFRAIDLTDVIAGEDLWIIEYEVSDFIFETNQGFSVYFDPTLYANLQNRPPAVSAGWDILVVQPDAGLFSADGFYDALALVDGASLLSPFTLSFTWLGGPGASPGPQFFTINQYDDTGALSFIESGETTPNPEVAPVPEPSTLLLIGAGAAMTLRRRRRPR